MNRRFSISQAREAYTRFNAAAARVQDPVLLAIRLYWGWQFFLTGKGKLLNLGTTAEFFGSLGIPFPALNAGVAGLSECIGGLLLFVGLGSRIAAVPLMFTMAIAYLTAERPALVSIFSEPEKFLLADPFLFLLAAILIFAFGPGRFSLDYLIARKIAGHAPVPSPPAPAVGGSQTLLPG